MESKEMLIELLGEKQGTSLYAKAVSISVKTGIDLNDVAQELALAAQVSIEKLGEYSEAYTVTVARNAMMNSNGYGVNHYYWTQGVREEYVEDRNEIDDDSEDGETPRDQAKFASVEFNLEEKFQEALSELNPDQRYVAEALVGGWQAQEIAASLGKSNAYVSRIKEQLRGVFAYAVSQ